MISLNLNFDIQSCKPPSEKDIKKELNKLNNFHTKYKSKEKVYILIFTIFFIISCSTLIAFIKGPDIYGYISFIALILCLLSMVKIEILTKNITYTKKLIDNLRPISTQKILCIPIIQTYINNNKIKDYCKAVSELKRDLVVAEYYAIKKYHEKSIQAGSAEEAYKQLKSLN